MGGEAALQLAAGILAAAAGIVFGPQLMAWGKPADTTALRISRFIDLSGELRTEEIPAGARMHEKLLRSGAEVAGITIDQAAKLRNSRQKSRFPIQS